MTLFIFAERDHSCDLFSRCKLQQVDDRSSSGCTAGLRNLICLQSVYTSGIGKEHEIMMGCSHQQLFNIIVLNGLHTLDSSAATVLTAEVINRHTLDVTKLGHCDHGILSRDQILCGNIVYIVSDGSLSVIAVFFCNSEDLLADHTEKKLTVSEDCLELADLLHKLCILGFQLLSFQTCQCTETHIHDCLSLNVCQLKTLNKFLFRDLYITGTTDDTDHFIDIIKCFQEAFQNVGSLLGFIQIVLCSSANNILLMFQIILQHLFQVQNFRFHASMIRNKGKHDHAKSILQLCMFVEQVQDHIGIGIFTEIDADTHTFTAGMVIQVCDSIDLFITDKLCDLLDKACLIYKVWKLCDYDTGFTIGQSLDICHSADTDLATTCTISFLDSSCSEDGCSCREVRSLDDLKKFFHCCLAVFFHNVINDLNNGINCLTKIMRWNIGRHTYSDTCCTVYQQIRKTCRKYNRLTFCLIKVRLEINGIFVDVCKHLHGNLAETCLCVSHGSRTVTIHGTKVSMSVNQRISC